MNSTCCKDNDEMICNFSDMVDADFNMSPLKTCIDEKCDMSSLEKTVNSFVVDACGVTHRTKACKRTLSKDFVDCDAKTNKRVHNGSVCGIGITKKMEVSQFVIGAEDVLDSNFNLVVPNLLRYGDILLTSDCGRKLCMAANIVVEGMDTVMLSGFTGYAEFGVSGGNHAYVGRPHHKNAHSNSALVIYWSSDERPNVCLDAKVKLVHEGSNHAIDFQSHMNGVSCSSEQIVEFIYAVNMITDDDMDMAGSSCSARQQQNELKQLQKKMKSLKKNVRRVEDQAKYGKPRSYHKKEESHIRTNSECRVVVTVDGMMYRSEGVHLRRVAKPKPHVMQSAENLGAHVDGKQFALSMASKQTLYITSVVPILELLTSSPPTCAVGIASLLLSSVKRSSRVEALHAIASNILSPQEMATFAHLFSHSVDIDKRLSILASIIAHDGIGIPPSDL
jgi:hypothetical protein